MTSHLIGFPIWDVVAAMSHDLHLIASSCYCCIVAFDVVFVAFYRYNLIGQERPNASRFMQTQWHQATWPRSWPLAVAAAAAAATNTPTAAAAATTTFAIDLRFIIGPLA